VPEFSKLQVLKDHCRSTGLPGVCDVGAVRVSPVQAESVFGQVDTDSSNINDQDCSCILSMVSSPRLSHITCGGNRGVHIIRYVLKPLIWRTSWRTLISRGNNHDHT
jgi:hypothetical protein